MEFQHDRRINPALDGVECALFVDLRCERQKKGKSVDGSQGGKKGCRRQLKRERRKEKERKEKKRKEKKERRTVHDVISIASLAFVKKAC